MHHGCPPMMVFWERPRGEAWPSTTSATSRSTSARSTRRRTACSVSFSSWMARSSIDRLDYVAPMSQEHAFCLAIEKLLGLGVPRRGQLIRVLFLELTRIKSHLLNITTQAMDVGALTPPLWGFEEREKLMVFYERASGSRLHANYFRPGGVRQDLPPELIDDIESWCETFPKVVDDLDELVIGNRIFKQRNVDIGVVSLDDAYAWGFTGPMLRGSGAPWDLRKAQPYECYEELDFDIPVPEF